jgi:hypothetical protein
MHGTQRCFVVLLCFLTHRTTAQQCELGVLPSKAFAVSPQHSDLPVCAWLCEEAFVRCPRSRAAGAWDTAASVLLPSLTPGSNSTADESTGDATDLCVKLPVVGAVLHTTVYATYDILTFEDAQYASRRAKALAAVLQRAPAIVATFPNTHPCWLWMREFDAHGSVQAAGWHRLQNIFRFSNATVPVPRPDYITSLQTQVPPVPMPEDVVLPNYAAVELQLLTGDIDTPLSAQAAALHRAIVLALLTTNETTLLALEPPSAVWLHVPSKPLLSGALVTAASLWGVALLALTITLFALVTQQKVRCVLCGEKARVYIV